MAREYPLMFKCKHEGCKEHVTYRYQRRRDRAESFEFKCYGREGWLCTRHVKPSEVLSAENLETVCELQSRQTPYGRYFKSSGFISGPGFKIWAADFPPGTKLIVTAKVILPEDDRSSETD